MTPTNHHEDAPDHDPDDATHRATDAHAPESDGWAGVPAWHPHADYAARIVEAFDGPGRVLAFLATALGLAARRADPLLSRMFHVAVREGGMVDAATAPVGTSPLGMSTAGEVLRHAAVAYAVAALDAIAADPTPISGPWFGWPSDPACVWLVGWA